MMLAPGVSPGFRRHWKTNKPAKRAARISSQILSPLPGLIESRSGVYPGLTPGAIDMPPAWRACRVGFLRGAES
jgi:hypothetical protein